MKDHQVNIIKNKQHFEPDQSKQPCGEVGCPLVVIVCIRGSFRNNDFGDGDDDDHEYNDVEYDDEEEEDDGDGDHDDHGGGDGDGNSSAEGGCIY